MPGGMQLADAAESQLKLGARTPLGPNGAEMPGGPHPNLLPPTTHTHTHAHRPLLHARPGSRGTPRALRPPTCSTKSSRPLAVRLPGSGPPSVRRGSALGGGGGGASCPSCCAPAAPFAVPAPPVWLGEAAGSGPEAEVRVVRRGEGAPTASEAAAAAARFPTEGCPKASWVALPKASDRVAFPAGGGQRGQRRDSMAPAHSSGVQTSSA